jgi:hypothetical protein
MALSIILLQRKAPDSFPKHDWYLQSFLTSPDIIVLVAQAGDGLAGCVIGALTTPPPSTIPAVLSILSTTSR